MFARDHTFSVSHSCVNPVLQRRYEFVTIFCPRAHGRAVAQVYRMHEGSGWWVLAPAFRGVCPACFMSLSLPVPVFGFDLPHHVQVKSGVESQFETHL
jgi:hypothetical protein